MEQMTKPMPTQNIAEIIISNPQLSTLQSALQIAGLTEILSGEGPFTVFAPTNDAFAYKPKVSSCHSSHWASIIWIFIYIGIGVCF